MLPAGAVGSAAPSERAEIDRAQPAFVREGPSASQEPSHSEPLAASPEADELPSIIDAYVRDFPGMSDAAARMAANGQGARAKLLEQVGRLGGFGGSWFDPPANAIHVYVTDEATASGVRDLATSIGLDVAIEAAEYTYQELDVLAREINANRTAEDVKSEALFAGVDGSLNRVSVVVMDESRLTAIREQFADDPRVTVEEIPDPELIQPTVCTARTACGKPARSGIVIGIDADGAGTGSATQLCSLGFTASATDGSLWIVTAGHCSSGIALNCPSSTACWGHGQQYFGPMRDTAFAGNLDVGRIRKANSYWTTGGWIYKPSAPEAPWAVDLAITLRSTIEVGDAVCQAVWHALPNMLCGTIVDTVSFQGLVETSIDSCGGDSGGGWYALIGSARWAYGIQSRADGQFACHAVGEHSYFSAIPDINAYWDSTSGATIRVEDQ